MLTNRQQRELDYHAVRAVELRGLIDEPIATDIVDPGPRRPWNAYWSLYDRLLAADLKGKRVLVPGCGFGEDAIRLAMLGAHVSGFDLSPESIEIAAERGARAGLTDIDLRVMPSETLDYADDSFDAVVFVDILHHVDIPATMAEVARVLRPGGLIVGDELYTHTMLQRVRESRLVAGTLYPLMEKWIYNGETPYITQDEHKIDEREFAIVRAAMTAPRIDYFGVAEGRLFPSRIVWATRIDRAAIRLARPVAARLASRVVFSGTVAKG